MAGGTGGGGRSLEQTPTWAVAIVCFVLVLVSIFIEFSIHLIGKWLKKKHKTALYEALEKIKSELMLLGFISLLLTVGQGPISNICISEKVGSTWHPCSKEREQKLVDLSVSGGSFRRLLAEETSNVCGEGKVPFISSDGIHQLHIFVFVLAVFHVLYCVFTMALGRAKMRKWKAWENETKTVEYQFSHDPERFRFARETSFGRRHLSFWTKTPLLIWIDCDVLNCNNGDFRCRYEGDGNGLHRLVQKLTVCFVRQFVRSVPKVDYLTLRHGFIMAHLAPQSHTKFDFQKYINRSLEEDFKVVVGISPPIWLFAVLFLLFNTHGWYSYLWLPFIPLIIILLVGTKLQVIITKMALRIQERGEIVKGVPVVEPGDDLFWFNRPSLILYLINFVLFQNAFQLAFFAWSWKEFGFKSCFHERLEDIIIRVSMGILIQILCSYVTLPLYALVTQMGSSMKPTIFNERVAAALRNWHQTAKKHIKQRKGSVTPTSSRPATPSRRTSPVHLLRHHRGETDSPRPSFWDNDSPSSSYQNSSHNPNHKTDSNRYEEQQIELGNVLECGGEVMDGAGSSQAAQMERPVSNRHEIDMVPEEFSFDKRATV